MILLLFFLSYIKKAVSQIGNVVIIIKPYVMNTIVVKGDHYSFNDVKLMEESVNLANCDEMVKVILVQPSGITKEVVTSYNTFKIVTESDDAIIYK